MPVGLQIFNDFGTVQIDENSETYVLYSKGSQTLNGRVGDWWQNWSIPSNVMGSAMMARYNTNGVGGPPGYGGNGSVLAFRPRIGSGAYVGVGWRPDGSVGFIGTNQSSPNTDIIVDWWYFVRPVAQGTGAGLELYKADGTVAYSSHAGRPMKMVAVANDSATSVNVPYSGDWALSIGTPFPCVGEYDYNGQFRVQERGKGFQVGNTFVSNLDFQMGVRVNVDSGAFINGRQPVATQLLIDVSGL